MSDFERLHRVRAGEYRTHDGRFKITSSGYQRSGQAWTVEDVSGRRPFRRHRLSDGKLEESASRLVDRLDEARQVIEYIRAREANEAAQR